MALQIQKAVKSQKRLRLALIGVSGSGKTYSALSIAAGLADRVLLIDTEHGSASAYADEFNFDVIHLESYDPRTYCEAITLAEKAGYGVIVIDSLSHAWSGKGGALELVEEAKKRSQGANSFSAWRDVTPLHNQLIDSIVGSKAHVIATIRAKTEYVQEKDERGKTSIRKVGLAPIQRDQMEYEFDVVGDMTQEHDLIITKSRCRMLSDKIINRPGAGVAETLREWLTTGAAAAHITATPAVTVTPTTNSSKNGGNSSVASMAPTPAGTTPPVAVPPWIQLQRDFIALATERELTKQEAKLIWESHVDNQNAEDAKKLIESIKSGDMDLKLELTRLQEVSATE